MSASERNTDLAEQAVTALAALAGGLPAALARGGLPPLSELVARDAEAVSSGLSAAILRIVFLLHAEARGLLGDEPARPVSELFERLWSKAERPPPRPSAWAELSALFRAAVGASPDGARPLGPSAEPLLDPDAFAFLAAPVDDATVARILSPLLIHEGTRLSYRDLDIEEIGGVYEVLIGFGLQVTTGASITLRPDHTLVDLEALLELAPERRAVFLAETAGVELRARASAALEEARSVAALVHVLRKRISPLSHLCPDGPDGLSPIPKGAVALTVTPARRRSGSHYTPPALTQAIVQATLGPLLGDGLDPARILALRVCDPAMGSGAFLLEACRFLGDRLLQARGQDPGAGEEARLSRALAYREIAARAIHGVDKDPIAVDLCRISLWLLTLAPGSPRGFLGDRLRCGDSLIGANTGDLEGFPFHAFERAQASPPGPLSPKGEGGMESVKSAALQRCLDAWTALWFWPLDDPSAAPAPTPVTFSDYLASASSADGPQEPAARTADAIAQRERFLHWETAFPAVFAGEPAGFDAIVGNPPWVAYAGRAAQPLAAATFNFYLRRSPAFFGYRTLHGLFIHRAATLLRPGGRLGLIVPTSVSDLKGYAPARAAHDHLCEPDPELPDFGADAFVGVFQPAMGLLSTRRAAKASAGSSWRLVRAELTLEAERLLERLAALPALPAQTFGERGYQTMSEDTARIRELGGPAPPFTIPLREGRDIGPFLRRPPRLHLDPRGIEQRIRPLSEWNDVKLLIRQTARYPIAALSDGQPFRNSVLAGFASEELCSFFLLCYLNSTPIRWFHFSRYRDARQGMPQVKIAHLRGLPAPPRGDGDGNGAEWKARLSAIGRAVGERNQGIGDEEHAAIDALVGRAFELSEGEIALIRAWARDNPLPRSSVG